MHLAKEPSKGKALKQKTVTEFFKPITDKDYHGINEFNVLRVLRITISSAHVILLNGRLSHCSSEFSD